MSVPKCDTGSLRTPSPFLRAWVTTARGVCVRHGLEQGRTRQSAYYWRPEGPDPRQQTRTVRKINGKDGQKLTPQSPCSDDCGWQPRLPEWEPSALCYAIVEVQYMKWWRLVDSSNAESHIVNLFQVLLCSIKLYCRSNTRTW